MAEPVERLVVTFFGHPCMTVRGPDGSIFVSLRDLCDLLGLRVASQARRLRNDPDLREGLARFRARRLAVCKTRISSCLKTYQSGSGA